MTVRSVSFDDEDGEEDLYVFSGEDLLISHYDGPDLDWGDVAERAALDQRRGLVVAQVAVLEDLIDEFILYLVDPPDSASYQGKLDRLTIGPRLDRLDELLTATALHSGSGAALLDEIRHVVARRNELAHGTIYRRPVQPVEPGSWVDGIDLEWVIVSRRTRSIERITMRRLRHDLDDAVGCFTELLRYAEWFVNHAPRPVNFPGGRYLAAPSP